MVTRKTKSLKSTKEDETPPKKKPTSGSNLIIDKITEYDPNRLGKNNEMFINPQLIEIYKRNSKIINTKAEIYSLEKKLNIYESKQATKKDVLINKDFATCSSCTYTFVNNNQLGKSNKFVDTLMTGDLSTEVLDFSDTYIKLENERKTTDYKELGFKKDFEKEINDVLKNSDHSFNK